MRKLHTYDTAVALANAQADNADLRAINARLEAERGVLQTHELHPVGTRERIAALEVDYAKADQSATALLLEIERRDQQLEDAHDKLTALEAERDQARRWARAWKRIAKRKMNRVHECAETISVFIMRQVDPTYLPLNVRRLRDEIGRLALMFASMDTLSGEDAARYVGDLLNIKDGQR